MARLVFVFSAAEYDIPASLRASKCMTHHAPQSRRFALGAGASSSAPQRADLTSTWLLGPPNKEQCSLGGLHEGEMALASTPAETSAGSGGKPAQSELLFVPLISCLVLPFGDPISACCSTSSHAYLSSSGKPPGHTCMPLSTTLPIAASPYIAEVSSGWHLYYMPQWPKSQ